MYNIGDKGLRSIDRDVIKGDFADNKADAAKFLRYTLTTYTAGGKTKVKNFDSNDLYMPNGDDDFSIFPRIDIKEGIKM